MQTPDLTHDQSLQSSTIESTPTRTPSSTDVLDPLQSLLALLPPSHNSASIIANIAAWLWGAENPLGTVLRPQNDLYLEDISAGSGDSAMRIAKTLLLFALYMQHLPSWSTEGFEPVQRKETTIETIAERVKVFILAREDEAYSLDGVECLVLLGLIQLNDGTIRKSWMTHRRLLDIARLQGLHNSYSLPLRNSRCEDAALRRRLWLSVVCGECYCSLLLGLEPGNGILPFGPDSETWVDPVADQDTNIQRRICLIVARIAQRNALGLHQDLATLQEIDDAMGGLQESLPTSWWRTPFSCLDQHANPAKAFARLCCQLWFFQAQIFAHMPLAFGTTRGDSMGSLEKCMEACRITIHRYLGLQHFRECLSRCGAVDQSVFVAAVVLMLTKVQLQQHKTCSSIPTYDSDRGLVEQVIDSFAVNEASYNRENVSRQISAILSKILELSIANPENDPLASSNKAFDLTTPSMLGSCLWGKTEIASRAKRGMKDIIASSIQPALSRESPASRLLILLLEGQLPGDVADSSQNEPHHHKEFSFEDLIDPSVLSQESR